MVLEALLKEQLSFVASQHNMTCWNRGLQILVSGTERDVVEAPFLRCFGKIVFLSNI